jgi:uroporphyrinogen-III decarboxylase
MAYDGVIKDFEAIRRKETPKRLPCVACSEEFDVKWYGKYDYEEFCQDGDKIFEVYKAAIEHFDYDWAWVQIDDCFEFEPMGVGCVGEGNILRATHGYLPATRECLGSLPVMNPQKDGRMPEKLKAIKKLRDYFGDSVLVVGSCAGPFSAVGLMWSIEESMIMMLTDENLLHDAMEYWKKFYMRYIKAQKEAGAHAIWFGDCNAFSSMLSVEQYNQYIFPQTLELVRYAEEELDVMMWMHNSEISIPHVLSHIPLGLSFESIGPAADIAAMRAATKGKHAISGNLNPIEVLWRGTSESIAKEVERIIGVCKESGGYIFNTGEMNPRQIPEENMLAMMKTAKNLAKY